MKNFRKKEKGITLVALVITIIILLILAGVSVNLVAGSRGIMSRTSNAVRMNDSATAAEQAELRIAEVQMDYYEGYYVSETISNSMLDYLEENASGSCANARYYLELAEGNVNVYVGSNTTGTLIASRKYKKELKDFQWEDNNWTYYTAVRGTETVSNSI